MKDDHPLWERLGRTRLMQWSFAAFEAWFDRMAERDHRRTRRTGPPAHEETSTLVWCDRNAVVHRYVTDQVWTRGGATPATCVACRSQYGLVLGWLSGHEERARFRCPCGASWSDPLWARKDAADYVRTASEFERTSHDHL